MEDHSLQETGTLVFPVKGERLTPLPQPHFVLCNKDTKQLIALALDAHNACFKLFKQCFFLLFWREDSLNIKYDLFPIKHRAQTKRF